MGGYKCSLQTDEQHMEPCDDQGSTHLQRSTALPVDHAKRCDHHAQQDLFAFLGAGLVGVVVNFQLDGNYNQSDYSVYLDKFNFTYLLIVLQLTESPPLRATRRTARCSEPFF